MHVLISRAIASIALGIATVAMPASALAQSHAPMAGTPARATALPPTPAHLPAGAPAQRAQPPRMSGAFRPHAGESAISEARQHRGFGAPIWWWGYPPQISAYDVNANPPAYENPVYDNPVGEEASNRPAADHHPYPYCRTDTQKVASTNGGEHTINITRCY
jgi:hypothetical protein